MRQNLFTDTQREILKQYVMTGWRPADKRQLQLLKAVKSRIRHAFIDGQLKQDYDLALGMFGRYCNYKIGSYIKNGSQSAKATISTDILKGANRTFRYPGLNRLVTETKNEFCDAASLDERTYRLRYARYMEVRRLLRSALYKKRPTPSFSDRGVFAK